MEFTTVEIKTGGKVEGTLQLPKGGAIPFNGTVSHKQSFCG